MKSKNSHFNKVMRIIAMLFLLAGAVIIMIPLLWTVCMALKPDSEIFSISVRITSSDSPRIHKNGKILFSCIRFSTFQIDIRFFFEYAY